MILQAILFYLFAIAAVGGGVMVVAARNPVHSVLFLILAFFNTAGLFILIGAEFLAMILVIVYVGAVAVLFLFVVMLDIDFVELRSGFVRYLRIGRAGPARRADIGFGQLGGDAGRDGGRRGSARRRGRAQQYPGAWRHSLHPVYVRLSGDHRRNWASGTGGRPLCLVPRHARGDGAVPRADVYALSLSPGDLRHPDPR